MESGKPLLTEVLERRYLGLQALTAPTEPHMVITTGRTHAMSVAMADARTTARAIEEMGCVEVILEDAT